MHNVVIEKPYSFFPPHHGRIWPKLLQRTLRRRCGASMESSRSSATGSNYCSNRLRRGTAY